MGDIKPPALPAESKPILPKDQQIQFLELINRGFPGSHAAKIMKVPYTMVVATGKRKRAFLEEWNEAEANPMMPTDYRMIVVNQIVDSINANGVLTEMCTEIVDHIRPHIDTLAGINTFIRLLKAYNDYFPKEVAARIDMTHTQNPYAGRTMEELKKIAAELHRSNINDLKKREIADSTEVDFEGPVNGSK